MNNFDMTSLIDRLRGMIESVITEKINALPISLPAKVVKRGKVTVSVVPCITFGTLDAAQIDDVPIAKSPYANTPIQDGDFGLLLPCSYFYQSIVTEDQKQIDSVIPTITTGNYVFLPLTQVGIEPGTGEETELWSTGLSRYLRVTDDEIQLGGNTGNVTEYAALDMALQLFITAFNAHVHTSAAVGAPTSAPVTPATLDISAAKVEEVTV
jgi:hypothetical protein